MTGQMRLVWPILEPPLGLFDLIDLAVDTIEVLAGEQGYTAVGTAREWEVEPGDRMPRWAAYRLVLTCIVPVIPRVDAALEEVA